MKKEVAVAGVPSKVFDTHKVLYSANSQNWDYYHDKICRNMTDQFVYEGMYPLITEAYNAYHKEVELTVEEAMKNVTSLTCKWSIDMTIAQHSAY